MPDWLQPLVPLLPLLVPATALLGRALLAVALLLGLRQRDHGVAMLLAGRMDALSDRVEGRLDFFGTSPSPDVKALVDAGKLKVLLVGSPRRMAQFPNVAAMSEPYPGTELSNWLALAAPPRTPADIINKLNAAVAAACKNIEVVQALDKTGFEVTASSPEAMAARVKSGLALTAPIVKRLGLKID